MDDHPANNDILFEDGLWKVVKTVEDKDYAEIWHNCEHEAIDHTSITIGDKKCDGCDEAVPENITTVATLYSKGVPIPKPHQLLDDVMQKVFWKMYLKSDLFKTHNKLTGITEPTE